MTIISRESAHPLYLQVADQLEDRLASGELKSGERLPSEAALTKQFGVSRVTVRQALAHLMKRGLVVKRQGKGTFIHREIKQELDRGTRTILEALREKGIEPKVIVLGLETVDPPEKVAEALGVEPGRPVMRLRRLYCVEDEPTALVYVYLKLEMSQVAVTLANNVTETTYSVFENTMGIQVKEARHIIKAIAAEEDVARALGLRKGDACLSMDRISMSTEGEVLEFLSFYHPPNSFQYELNLPRRHNSFVLKVWEP